jgi:hypothetical protein
VQTQDDSDIIGAMTRTQRQAAAGVLLVVGFILTALASQILPSNASLLRGLGLGLVIGGIAALAVTVRRDRV